MEKRVMKFWRFHVDYIESDCCNLQFCTLVSKKYKDATKGLGWEKVKEVHEQWEDLFTYGSPISVVVFEDEETAIRYLEEYLTFSVYDSSFNRRRKLRAYEVTGKMGYDPYTRTWSTGRGKNDPMAIISLHQESYMIA